MRFGGNRGAPCESSLHEGHVGLTKCPTSYIVLGKSVKTTLAMYHQMPHLEDDSGGV